MRFEKLSEKKRAALYIEIKEKALACAWRASVAEIDELNILHATMLAMQRAVAGLESSWILSVLMVTAVQTLTALPPKPW